MCEDTTNTGTLGTLHLCITHRHETNTGSGGCPPGYTSPLTTINHRLLLMITVADLHWHTKTQPAPSLKAFIAVISGAFRLSHVLGFYLFCSVSSYIILPAFLFFPHLALGSRPSCSAPSAPIIISAFFSFVCLPDFNSSGCSYR